MFGTTHQTFEPFFFNSWIFRSEVLNLYIFGKLLGFFLLFIIVILFHSENILCMISAFLQFTETYFMP